MIIEYKYNAFNEKTGTYELKRTAVEVSEEIGISIKESRRKEDASDHRHKYYCPVSTDEAKYEGMAYADPTVDFYINTEEEKKEMAARKEAEVKERSRRTEYAFSKLSEVQQRRLLQLAEGKTLREIAVQEGVSFQSVHESVEAAKKRFKKFF